MHGLGITLSCGDSCTRWYSCLSVYSHSAVASVFRVLVSTSEGFWAWPLFHIKLRAHLTCYPSKSNVYPGSLEQFVCTDSTGGAAAVLQRRQPCLFQSRPHFVWPCQLGGGWPGGFCPLLMLLKGWGGKHGGPFFSGMFHSSPVHQHVAQCIWEGPRLLWSQGHKQKILLSDDRSFSVPTGTHRIF